MTLTSVPMTKYFEIKIRKIIFMKGTENRKSTFQSILDRKFPEVDPKSWTGWIVKVRNPNEPIPCPRNDACIVPS
jgi:hypothetical protein